jgi:O-antigen ligase
VAKRSAETLLRSLGDLLLGALVVLAPFVVVVTAADAFRLPKLLASEWLGLASLLAYALAATLRGGGDDRVPPWRRPAVLAVAAVLAAASLGLLTGVQAGRTREALADLWIAGACLAGWSLALPARRLERFLGATAIPGSLMALLAVLQFHGAFQPFRFTGGEESLRLGVTALAGNPGDLGGFLVLPALVAQSGLLRALRRARSGAGAWGRAALWGLTGGLCGYGLVASQTLTAMAALAAGTAVFWLLALPARRALAAAAGAVVLAGAVLAAAAPLRTRAVQVAHEAAAGHWNQALSGRLDGWRAALWMFRQHPWTGVGQGAYASRFAAAKLELQAHGVPFYTGHVDPFFANAHNDFLEALAEWGLVGAVALAGALWLLGRALFARGRAPSAAEARRARAFAWAATLAAAVLAAGHFPFHLALVAYPYLLFFAWVFRRAVESEEAEA